MIKQIQKHTLNTKSDSQKVWEWLPCIYDFKQEYEGKELIWNFSPYVLISDAYEKVSNLLQKLLAY